MDTAAKIYADNVRETRAHFAAAADALYDEWLSTDMDIFTRDSRMVAIRAQEARYIADEANLYRLAAGR